MNERKPTYCALCVSRCGATAVVEDGRFTSLEPDPSHPTGQALCAKGRAAPELVYHPERLLHPLKRTRPKRDPDPGWQRIGWEEALGMVADRLRAIASTDGPESVVFAVASPSTSASDDWIPWLDRLRRAYGSPNLCASMELCGWGRYFATAYTFGASVPGAYMPDLENAGCILYWGYNPHVARIAHAVGTTSALKRGARLIVVDPRRAGAAHKADVWLRVRPGTDAALALGITQVMLRRGWWDEAFVRQWTNVPLLVREDTGRLLRASEIGPGDGTERYVAWSPEPGGPVLYDPSTGAYGADPLHLALTGRFTVETAAGAVVARPVFDHVVEQCGRYPPERIEAICGVPRSEVEAAAKLLWEARPVAYYAWSGVEMQADATQIARAIAQLYALTGSLDRPGGNVLFGAVPRANVAGDELLPPERARRTLGLRDRPLGPSRWQFTASHELYRGILEGDPYRVRGLVGFGANLLMAQADSRRGREALAALEFHVHADLFMNPTAALADVVLPVASAFEREALRIGFDISPEAQSRVQLREPVVEPRGESRSDVQIIFELAQRLGLGDAFWGGDVDAAYRHQLGPSGVSLDALRARPEGIRVPVETRYRKFAEERDGIPAGFRTATRKIELYSEALLEGGFPPLPQPGDAAGPPAAEGYPLVLTCAKHTLFCETQHRGLPSLRRRAMDPEVEIHPETAAARGIAAGDWVFIETPKGRVRARARLEPSLAPDVVCGQHGWWQACPEIGAPAYDPWGPDGANYNLLIGTDRIDPVSGSVPHRAYVCDVRPVEPRVAPAAAAAALPLA